MLVPEQVPELEEVPAQVNEKVEEEAPRSAFEEVPALEQSQQLLGRLLVQTNCL